MSRNPRRTREEDELGVASLSGALHCGLVLAQVDESGSQSSPVGNALEQKLGGLVKLIVEALLADLKDISNVGHAKEVFHVVQAIGLCVSIGKLRIDLGLAKRLAGHLEVADQIVVLASPVGEFDDFKEVAGVFSLDIGI